MERFSSPQEDRLVLLCALDRIGRCSEDQLLRFSLEAELMAQFDFYVALAQLKESGQIRENVHPEGKLLSATPEGKKNAALFAEHMRPSVAERLEQMTPDWKRRIREELAMPATWERVPEGYQVRLRALEEGTELFGLTILAVDREQAVRYCRRWQACGTSIYQNALRELGSQEPADPQAN